ncbi:g11864 [Coccomyxa elongata]
MAAQSTSMIFDATAVALGCASIAFLFNRYAAESYMDEIFHVPQTAKYCQGNLTEWDPKITTFPGMYMLGAPYGLAVHAIQRLLQPLPWQAACSTTILRSLNVLLAAAFFGVFAALYRRLHPSKQPEYATLMALVALLLPTHFFYAFIYYTDVGSVTFVLASYLASLQGRHHLSAVLGALAVSFRQTNAVWVVFILGAAVVRWAAGGGDAMTGAEKKLAGLKFERAMPGRQLLHVMRMAWLHKWRLLRELWSLASVPAAFAVFVVVNGGIVVGDRGNHTPVLHIMQLPYLLLFATGALAPMHFNFTRLNEASRQLRGYLRRDAGKALRLWASLALLTGYAAHSYTLAHPFLLADNRHYTFYIWKDFLSVHPAAKYTLVPAYLYCAWTLWWSLLQGRRTLIWVLGFTTACALTLIPAWLVDFRYFTVPFMMLLLHMKPPTVTQATLTLALYALVNAAAIYMFLFRPFVWPDGSIARFMY